MCTSPWSCFMEARGTNRDLTRLQIQLSLQQHFTWKYMISVFFQSPKELRLCTCYAQKNFHLHRISVKQRRVTEKFVLVTPLALISRQSSELCFLNFMLKSCYGFQVILHSVNPSPSVEWGLYPEKSPENWNKGFSDRMQGSMLLLHLITLHS